MSEKRMIQPKIKVNADRYSEYKEDMGGLMGADIVPTGYRGRQIFPDKDNSDNLANAQDDIREYYGLTNCNGLDEDGE